MGDRSGKVLKRLHPPEDDDLESQKRVRSNNGSPRPTTPSSATPGAGAKPDVTQMVAAARARAEELKARIAASKSGAGATTAAPAAPSSASPAPAAGSAADRIAQLKARVAAATSRSTSLSQQQRPSSSTSYTPPSHNDDNSKARGGLDVGLHPALLADSQQDARSKARTPQPKFGIGAGGRRGTESPAPGQKKAQLDLSGPSLEELKANPYFDASLGPRNVVAKGRHSRQLIFNEKGKYIQQAAALRRQAQLEAMKKKIAERARLAGLEEDMDTDKSFLVPAPPPVEWWDEGLIDGPSYDALDDDKGLKVETPDSIVTIYIQHPVLIEPPQEKNNPAPKPMYLTAKEQAKLRRQRRMADLKEQQAKVRLGLEPPPPPKVKKGNLMRVLGEEAVKDPTAVEARVNREIAARHQQHEDANQSRKLTKEQRHEKLERQQVEDAARGIHVRVYRIDSLANGKHRYQVSINADQNRLTGVVLLHPRLNVVVVEGGEHSIRNYDKLMQHRVRWTEMEAPRAVEEGNREALAKWLEAEDDNGDLKDLSLNKCELVFKGEAKQRAFRKWLGARVCETDAQARDVLSRAKMDNFWNLAKSFKKDF